MINWCSESEKIKTS